MKTKKFKFRYVLIPLLIVLVAVGGFLLYQSIKETKPVIKIETIPNNGDTAIKKKYYVVRKNQRVNRISKFTPDRAKVINVDPDVFKSYEKSTADSSWLDVYVTKPNIYKKKDKNLNLIVKDIAKVSHHELAIVKIFKLHHHYYAYVSINAGISDASYFYRFYPKSHKFKKLCDLEEGEIVGIKELK